MKLAKLQPRVAVLNTRRVAMLQPTNTEVERLRGRAGVERRARWLQQHPFCADCLKQGLRTLGDKVDHIVPLADGGQDEDSNLQTLCDPHHDAKTAREATERARRRARGG